MKILAIETSCDETAIALVEAKGGVKRPRFKIEQSLVASQIEIHRPFGGVVPNLAKREHLKNLPILLEKLQIPDDKLQAIDLIAVTVGPGLEPALWTGINFARDLYRKLIINNQRATTKLIGVNHLEGHLYSHILENARINKKEKLFPAIALIISGGHTILLLMKDLIHYKKLGETRDDAVGESFDKVARLLNLPYPGGPEIEKIAKQGNPNAINFPRPMIGQKNYDFSFSGLKTAVLYYLRDHNAEQRKTEYETIKKIISVNQNYNLRAPANAADVAASFQQAVFDVLIAKTLKAVKEVKAQSLIIGGGVAANRSLQKEFKKKIKEQKLKLNLFIPSPKFCTDNAAIIAAAGYINFLKNKKRTLKAQGSLNL